mmetsp:Transcript_1819/g.6520  ORF Transcript_1819/g.6520 Transcript_1819/m.6520 type:complete len:425 (-) Transcript_1819:192-1466(-)
MVDAREHQLHELFYLLGVELPTVVHIERLEKLSRLGAVCHDVLVEPCQDLRSGDGVGPGPARARVCRAHRPVGEEGALHRLFKLRGGYFPVSIEIDEEHEVAQLPVGHVGHLPLDKPLELLRLELLVPVLVHLPEELRRPRPVLLEVRVQHREDVPPPVAPRAVRRGWHARRLRDVRRRRAFREGFLLGWGRKKEGLGELLYVPGGGARLGQGGRRKLWCRRGCEVPPGGDLWDPRGCGQGLELLLPTALPPPAFVAPVVLPLDADRRPAQAGQVRWVRSARGCAEGWEPGLGLPPNLLPLGVVDRVQVAVRPAQRRRPARARRLRLRRHIVRLHPVLIALTWLPSLAPLPPACAEDEAYSEHRAYDPHRHHRRKLGGAVPPHRPTFTVPSVGVAAPLPAGLVMPIPCAVVPEIREQYEENSDA